MLIEDSLNDHDAVKSNGIFSLSFYNEELIASSDYSRNLLDAL